MDFVLASWAVVVMTAAVPILNSPHYLHARYETEASLLMTTVITLYLVLFHKPHLKKNEE